MQDAIILGGGISGLTAAYLLQKQGLEVTALEKKAQAGGPISSLSSQGYLVERGPNSLLLPDPWVESFFDELGLSDELLETSPQAEKRFIVKNGRLIAVPTSPIQAITTPLFSLKGKLGFLLEPFRPRVSDVQGSQETVADFVSRRMGPDFLDYAIDPFVSGVYAGDPRELILEHAFPLMRGFEKEGGSIIRGALRHKKRRRAEGATYKKRSVSFRNGLGVLPQTLACKLGSRLWLDSQVVAARQIDGGWKVDWTRQGETYESVARHLFVCLPSHATKKIAWPNVVRKNIQKSPDLKYPAVHSLALGFKRSQIAHALDGFGVLVPSKEPHDILGALFSSSLYLGRAPEGHCLITVMIGGMRRPEFASLSKTELVEIALKELRQLVGLEGDPSFVHLSSWTRAIPQYTREFGLWRDTLKTLEKEIPTLHFGGNSVDGIAMGASILSGKRLSELPID